jgi:SAM-dependent methyltransferase
MTNTYYEEYWKKDNTGWTPSWGSISADEKYLFARHLAEGTRCLDYGCGDGLRYGKALRERGVQYLGYDISESAVKQSQELGLNVKLLTAEGKTGLADSSVDAAICFEVLEHLMEPQKALEEIFRGLRPGGIAMLSVPNAGFYTARIEFLLTGFICPGGSPHTARKTPWCDPHIRFYYPAMLRNLARSVGFEVEAERGEVFTFRSLPMIWKRKSLHPVMDALAYPLGWLGRVLPSWFACRLFLVARKPASSVVSNE